MSDSTKHGDDPSKKNSSSQKSFLNFHQFWFYRVFHVIVKTNIWISTVQWIFERLSTTI